MKVCIWPRRNWIKPSIIDLAYALRRAADRHPLRNAFGGPELHYDFAGPLPATASRVSKHRMAELQRCVRSLGLEIHVAVAGSFSIRRMQTPARSTEERIAA